jgi:hypothetical protein
MSNVKTLSVSAVKVGMALIKNGVAFGEKLAQANREFAEKLTNRKKSLIRLVNDIKQFGISPVRIVMAKKIYNDELKGRTLASIVQSLSQRQANAIDKAIDDDERANINLKFELIATLEIENLKFLQALLAEPKKEAVKAEAVAVEA